MMRRKIVIFIKIKTINIIYLIIMINIYNKWINKFSVRSLIVKLLININPNWKIYVNNNYHNINYQQIVIINNLNKTKTLILSTLLN